MKSYKRLRSIGGTLLLVVVLASLLLFYLYAVSDLPSRVYTDSQQEFLRYNSQRSVQQSAPTLNYYAAPVTVGDKNLPADQDESTVQDAEILPAILPWRSSRVVATLIARYEEQDGVSVTVYDLDFEGEYLLEHTGEVSATVDLFFPFPSNLETLHNVYFLVDETVADGAEYSTQGIHWQMLMEPGEEHSVVISYRADGANSFTYGLMRDQRTDIDIAVRVVGLEGSSVPKGALPASKSEPVEHGELWTWTYEALIADRNIRLDLPTRLSFAQRVAQLQSDFRALSQMAPFLVGGFLVALAMMFSLSGLRLRLESYLLVGLGIALFYPLLTFLSGMVSLLLASALSLLLTSALVLAFLGFAAGWRTTTARASLLLVVFLGFFSLGTLTPWSGLLLTLGGLLLVAAFMLLYARRAIPPEPEPLPEDEEGDDSGPEAGSEPEAEIVTEAETPIAQPPVDTGVHCPHCARLLETDYAFCPGCGHDTGDVRRCPYCDQPQIVASELNVLYCVRCGEKL